MFGHSYCLILHVIGVILVSSKSSRCLCWRWTEPILVASSVTVIKYSSTSCHHCYSHADVTTLVKDKHGNSNLQTKSLDVIRYDDKYKHRNWQLASKSIDVITNGDKCKPGPTLSQQRFHVTYYEDNVTIWFLMESWSMF